MKPSEYNRREYEAGRLQKKHIDFLGNFKLTVIGWGDFGLAVVDFQTRQKLVPDGKCGKNTRARIESLILPKCIPVEPYNGRDALVSCPFGDKRTRKVKQQGVWVSEPYIHAGSDFMHLKVKGDITIPGVPVYHGGGQRDWWMPTGIRAAAAGVITSIIDQKNGHGIWIDHGNGERTMYLHLAEPMVDLKQVVAMGEKIALPLFDEKRIWPPHLHGEVSRVDAYKPFDMAKWLGI